MDFRIHLNDEFVHLFIVTASTIGAILTTIFSLSHGIFEVFPFLYILSTILVVYFYPRYGMLFSLGISLFYIGLVFFFGFAKDPVLLAIAIGWFAVINMIGVVTSSFAIRVHNERKKTRKVLENANEGIFCFELRSIRLHEVNRKCAHMLHYEPDDLIGKPLTIIWTNEEERADFLACIRRGQGPCQKEVMLRASDGTHRQYLVSAILAANNLVLCFTLDTSEQKIDESVIWQTLEDLERQVVERTAYLEKINEDLKTEIVRRRMDEKTVLRDNQSDDRRGERQ
jgi:PAS domain S-box-containing protein